MIGPSNQQKNYDTTTTRRIERKHSRRSRRDGRRHRRGINRLGNGNGSGSQPRWIYPNPGAWNSGNRFYGGDRFLRVVPSTSLNTRRRQGNGTPKYEYNRRRRRNGWS